VQKKVPVPGEKPKSGAVTEESLALMENQPGNDDTIKQKSSPEVKSNPVTVNSKPKYHVVKKGEYLTKIANQYHVSVNDLTAWNKLKTKNLIVGQKLRINDPRAESNIAAKADTNDKVHAPAQLDSKIPEKLVFYTVQSGDTLWSIAEKYEGITVNQIREWNNLKAEEKLKVGQKIKVIIPGG
jgi:membrane-bound lytic murein transglycosylase D